VGGKFRFVNGLRVGVNSRRGRLGAVATDLLPFDEGKGVAVEQIRFWGALRLVNASDPISGLLCFLNNMQNIASDPFWEGAEV